MWPVIEALIPLVPTTAGTLLLFKETALGHKAEAAALQMARNASEFSENEVRMADTVRQLELYRTDRRALLVETKMERDPSLSREESVKQVAAMTDEQFREETRREEDLWKLAIPAAIERWKQTTKRYKTLRDDMERVSGPQRLARRARFLWLGFALIMLGLGLELLLAGAKTVAPQPQPPAATQPATIGG